MILAGWAGDVPYPQGPVNRQFAMFRQLNDGSFDPSFGTNGNGVTTLDLYGGNDAIVDMAHTPEGIYVVGYAFQYSSRYHVLARYTHAGVLDTTFGTNGLVHMFNGPNGVITAINALAIQPDGKIMIGGSTQNGNADWDFLLARFNTNGTHDTSFGTNGMVRLSVGTTQDIVHDLVVQPNGRILMVGDILDNGVRGAIVIGLEPSGIFDFTFGSNGRTLITRNSTEIHGRRLALTGEGDVMVGSTALELPGYRHGIHVARLSANGVIDSSFSNGGNFDTFNLNTYRTIGAIDATPDGKIVIAGGFPPVVSNGVTFSYTARYNASGALDPGFNGTGYKLADIGSIEPIATSAEFIAIAPDGKFYVGGYSGDSNIAPSYFFLLRYQGDELDLLPGEMSFMLQKNVQPSTLVTSEPLYVTGLSRGARVPLTISGGMYSLNGGPATDEMSMVKSGDSVQLLHASSPSYSTHTITTLQIGGVAPANNRNNPIGPRMIATFGSTTTPAPGSPGGGPG